MRMIRSFHRHRPSCIFKWFVPRRGRFLNTYDSGTEEVPGMVDTLLWQCPRACRQQFKHTKFFERGEHAVYMGRDAHLQRRELIEIPFVTVQHIASIREQWHTLRSQVPAWSLCACVKKTMVTSSGSISCALNASASCHTPPPYTGLARPSIDHHDLFWGPHHITVILQIPARRIGKHARIPFCLQPKGSATLPP